MNDPEKDAPDDLVRGGFSGSSRCAVGFAVDFPRQHAAPVEHRLTSRTSLHASTVLLAFACLAGSTVSLPGQQQQPSPPKFRTGVEITPVDVTVLDEQRRPIRGLTAEDFVVRVDGKIQRIAAFNEIEIPTASTKSAGWTQEAERDVASNQLDDPRLFVIIMDDQVAPLRDFATRNTGKAVAHKIIDTMGPQDMAAIIFSLENEDSQDLTSDKAALRQAVEKYQPDGARGVPALETVRLTRQFLQETLPGHRRAIVYITAGFDVEDSALFWTLRSSLEEPDGPEPDGKSAAANASRASHVPIYLFNAEGLVAQGPRDTRGGHAALSYVSRKSEDLRTLARGSGGRAIVDTNAPQLAVDEMFDEQGSYYQIAYEHTYPLDGRYRRLQIEVKRPNSTVLPESLMFRAPDPTKRAARARLASGTTSGLTAALSGAVPSGAVPLRLSPLPVASADPRSATAAVAMTLAVTLPPQESSAQRLDVQTLVFDGAGRRELMKLEHAVSIPEGAGREAEVMSRLDLKPGRYNVRIAVTRSSDAKSGSIYTTFTVPDFQRDPLSLSGVAIGRASGAAIAGREALADVLPFAPTSSRDFASSDKVGALIRIHQSSKRPARPVSVVTRVIDENGKQILESSAKYEAANFEGGKGIEHRFEFPLTTLAAGDYLLTFLATTGEGGAQGQREVRFSVR